MPCWPHQLLLSRLPMPPGTRAWGHIAIGTLFMQATSEERLVRSLKLLFSSSPPVFLSKAPPCFMRTAFSSFALNQQLFTGGPELKCKSHHSLPSVSQASHKTECPGFPQAIRRALCVLRTSLSFPPTHIPGSSCPGSGQSLGPAASHKAVPHYSVVLVPRDKHVSRQSDPKQNSVVRFK